MIKEIMDALTGPTQQPLEQEYDLFGLEGALYLRKNNFIGAQSYTGSIVVNTFTQEVTYGTTSVGPKFIIPVSNVAKILLSNKINLVEDQRIYEGDICLKECFGSPELAYEDCSFLRDDDGWINIVSESPNVVIPKDNCAVLHIAKMRLFKQ